jgi:glycosyltransferase involved in cell wall biosynthesis
MISEDIRIVIITPVYEDVEASTKLFTELAKQYDHGIRIIAIDDGSIRQSLKIEALEDAGLDGTILRLRRNVGHQRAIAIGLGFISNQLRDDQIVVIMDSDGEDLPKTIPELTSLLVSNDVDAVVAQRASRIESVKFKLFYTIYKFIFRKMTGRSISFGNFMALKAHAVRRLVVMQELSLHVAAALIASKLRTKLCPINRGPRYAGKSNMNFVGLILHGFKGLMVFAEDVLVRIGIACAITGSMSIIGAIAAGCLKLYGLATPGWFSVALGLLFLMLLQTIALAVMTLMTLMLTGVVRGASVATVLGYRDFIESILDTDSRYNLHRRTDR